VSPVKYELGIYITEDDILHSHPHEHLKSLNNLYMAQKAIQNGGSLLDIQERKLGHVRTEETGGGGA
jgi:hypothetical protein